MAAGCRGHGVVVTTLDQRAANKFGPSGDGSELTSNQRSPS